MRPPERANKLLEAAEIAREVGLAELRRLAKQGGPAARKVLKRFPGVGEPGADKLLLAAGGAVALAPESNGLRVLVRLGYAKEDRSYAKTYRSAAEAVAPELPGDRTWLVAAHQLLRRHGQETCRRSEPRCDLCPLARVCAYALGIARARNIRTYGRYAVARAASVESAATEVAEVFETLDYDTCEGDGLRNAIRSGLAPPPRLVAAVHEALRKALEMARGVVVSRGKLDAGATRATRSTIRGVLKRFEDALEAPARTCRPSPAGRSSSRCSRSVCSTSRSRRRSPSAPGGCSSPSWPSWSCRR